MSLRDRLDDLGARLRDKEAAAGRPGPAGPQPAFDDGYWAAVGALFTRDVTGRGLLEFLQSEPRETVRFLTRGVDLAGLARQPWPRRLPLTVWRIFQATAYRLSPPRRILFAIATPLVLFGWFSYLILQGGLWRWTFPSFFAWVLIAASLLLFLLVLELRDKLSLKGDLEVARQIQFGLLPFEPYSRHGLGIRVSMRPANTVGGDYFDIVELGQGRTAVAVGDVAGKGMPAALLMALLQGSLQTLLTAGLRGAVLVTKLNEHLCGRIPSNRLITLFYAEVDEAMGELRYVNAGHNPPLLLAAGEEILSLPATGLALGILPEASYEEARCTLAVGDRLVLYTDGVTEACNLRDEEYGEPRLRSFLASRRGLAAPQLVDGVVADVLAHCGAARPTDDMTLLCLDRLSATAGGPRDAP
jgi:sigma-B regulation protein RsbU (phosphoserine phosphatase)